MKKLILLLSLLLALGCAGTMDQTKRVDQLENRVAELEIMLGAGVGANFYPARSIAGSGTGSIGNISSVVDKDFALAQVEEDATYGEAAFPWFLDQGAGAGDDTNTPPNYVESGDSTDRWVLGGWVGKFLSGNNRYKTTASNPTSLTCFDVRGGFIHVGATLELDLPSVTNCADISGENTPCFIVFNSGAYTITIDPDASDRILREGTAQSDGVSMTLSSGAGNYVGMCIDGATGWTTLGFSGTLAAGS